MINENKLDIVGQLLHVGQKFRATTRIAVPNPQTLVKHQTLYQWSLVKGITIRKLCMHINVCIYLINFELDPTVPEEFYHCSWSQHLSYQWCTAPLQGGGGGM